MQTNPASQAAIIVAMASDRAIGRCGEMPWHLPPDLRHFKKLTLGHPVIMGRRTWLSLPAGPLPGRRNIVVSQTPGFSPAGAEIVSSPEEALEICQDGPFPFIIGGGELYRTMLPLVSRLYITQIKETYPDADTFFPDFDRNEWIPDPDFIEEDGSHNGLEYIFTALKRRS